MAHSLGTCWRGFPTRMRIRRSSISNLQSQRDPHSLWGTCPLLPRRLQGRSGSPKLQVQQIYISKYAGRKQHIGQPGDDLPLLKLCSCIWGYHTELWNIRSEECLLGRAKRFPFLYDLWEAVLSQKLLEAWLAWLSYALLQGLVISSNLEKALTAAIDAAMEDVCVCGGLLTSGLGLKGLAWLPKLCALLGKVEAL